MVKPRRVIGRRTRPATGATLLEVLMALGIIVVLSALILPAVLRARAQAKLVHCQSNIRQIGVAFSGYATDHNVFPSLAYSMISWRVRLLPYLEQNALYDQINTAIGDSPYIKGNSGVRPMMPGLFACPSVPINGDNLLEELPPDKPSNYFGNIGTHFSLPGKQDGSLDEKFLPLTEVTDGLSKTAMISERLPTISAVPNRFWIRSLTVRAASPLDFPAMCLDPSTPALTISPVWSSWLLGEEYSSAYDHIIAPNGPACRTYVVGAYQGRYTALTATSFHDGGVNILFADGSCRFISENIDTQVWWAAGTRSRGEVSMSW